jgi:hypothetical protein
MHRRGFLVSLACDCGAEEQAMRHIVDDCPLWLFADGVIGLCAMSDETVESYSGSLQIIMRFRASAFEIMTQYPRSHPNIIFYLLYYILLYRYNLLSI